MEKIAQLDVSVEAIEDGIIGVLKDGGISVIGSEKSLEFGRKIVSLFVEGDILPDECRESICKISVTFLADHYGRQRLVRVGEIKLSDKLIARDLVS